MAGRSPSRGILRAAGLLASLEDGGVVALDRLQAHGPTIAGQQHDRPWSAVNSAVAELQQGRAALAGSSGTTMQTAAGKGSRFGSGLAW